MFGGVPEGFDEAGKKTTDRGDAKGDTCVNYCKAPGLGVFESNPNLPWYDFRADGVVC